VTGYRTMNSSAITVGQDHTVLANRGPLGPVLTIGGTFFGLWVITVLWLWLSSGQNPLDGFANRASAIISILTVIWIGCVVLFVEIVTWVNMPNELLVREDSVEGSPPREYGNPPRPRQVVIRFEDVRSIGWGGLGPCVLAGPGGVRAQDRRDAMLLVTSRNARILREKWLAWKGLAEQTAVNTPVGSS
jgi:hypothetical protein